MSGFGAYLRKRREEKGLTLEEVAEKTRIHLRYLEAIEAGSFHLLPGPAYVRGFLRLYADCIGLEPEAVVEMFRQTEAVKSFGRPSAGEPVGEEPLRRESRERVHSAREFVALVVFLTLFGAVATWLSIRAGM